MLKEGRIASERFSVSERSFCGLITVAAAIPKTRTRNISVTLTETVLFMEGCQSASF